MKILFGLMLIFLMFNTYGGEKFNPEFDRTEMDIQIKVKMYNTRLGVTRAFNKFLGDARFEMNNPHAIRQGFAVWSPVGSTPLTCTIHTQRPESNRMSRLLDHEMKHCLYGRWHK